MRAIIHGFHTEIFPNEGEVKRLCKPGQGADTCVFLAFTRDGWECFGLNKRPIMFVIDRAEREETHARRMGCRAVLEWSPLGLDLGEVDIQV